MGSRVGDIEYRIGEGLEGVPLGGLGTGFVSLGTDGWFTKIVTQGNPRSPTLRPKGSFFAIHISSRDERIVETLRNPAFFNLPPIRDLKYIGHFPFIDIEFLDRLPINLSLTAFSPFIPNDAEKSGIPGALFQFILKNIGEDALSISLTFSWEADLKIEGYPNSNLLRSGDIIGFTFEGVDGGYAVAGVEENDVRVEVSQPWMLGEDVWSEFMNTGGVRGLGKGFCRTILSKFSLNPGEEKRVRFALSWFFPDLLDSNGKFIGRMYENLFKDAGDVVFYSLKNFDKLFKLSRKWQEKFYRLDIPEWIKDLLVNGLYSMAKNTLWIKDGRFAHSESFTGCPITETIVCRFNGSLPILLFFPELELKVIRYFASLQREDGAIPFAFGRPEVFDKPYYETQKSLDSSEFILMVYRDFLFTNNIQFLKDVWKNVRKAVEYAQTLDTDNDGLINEVSMQYYDVWKFYGTSAYVAGIWLASLRAAEEMAKILGDMEFAEKCRNIFERGLKSFEQKLWNGFYYRLYNEPETGKISETCLLNQLMGQLYAYLLGLGEIFPRKHVLSALKSIYKYNVRATEFGAVNGVQPNGEPEPGPHSETVIFGEVMNYAATCLYAGLRKEGLEAAEKAYKLVFYKNRSPWNIYFSYDRNSGKPVWGSDYYSNMCVWHLLPAWFGVNVKELRKIWSKIVG